MSWTYFDPSGAIKQSGADPADAAALATAEGELFALQDQLAVDGAELIATQNQLATTNEQITADDEQITADTAALADANADIDEIDDQIAAATAWIDGLQAVLDAETANLAAVTAERDALLAALSALTVVITSGPADGATLTETFATYSFFSTDPTYTFEVSVDSGPWIAETSPFTTNPLEGGSHTFSVRAKNPTTGTTGTPVTRTFTTPDLPPIDVIAPDTTITFGPADGSTTTDPTPTWKFTSNDSTATFEVQIDGGSWVARTSPYTQATLGDGSHTFAVRATDPAGNVGAAATRTFTVDTSVPNVTITSGPTDGQTISDSTPTWKFDSDDVSATFEVSLDSAAFVAQTSPYTTGTLAEGFHSFSVRAKDPGGSTSPATTVGFIVDTTPPDALITGGPANGSTVADNTPTWTFASSDPSATFEVRIDGGSWTPATSPYTTATLADGPHTFDVRAKDPQGNVSATNATRSITVDTGAPDVAITSGPANGETITDPTPTWKFESSDPSATFEVSIDFGAWTAQTSPYTEPTLADGSHGFAVRAKDTLGNTGAQVNRGFVVDTTPPDTGVLPYRPAAPVSTRSVWAWYHPAYPISRDNGGPYQDYYVDATAQHSATYATRFNIVARGGFMRERPLGRLPRGTNYQALDAADEVARAKAAGISGFIIDMFDFGVNNPSSFVLPVAQAIINAANADGTFKIILAADLIEHTAGGSGPPPSAAALANRISLYWGYSSIYRNPANNRIVIGIWRPTSDNATYWTSVKNALIPLGHTVDFFPTYNTDPPPYASFAPISFMQGTWGSGSPSGTAPYVTAANTVRSVGSSSGGAGTGKWAQPVKIDDDRPSDAVMWEAQNTGNLRSGFAAAEATTADMAVIVTWNDYGESFCAPTDSYGYLWADLIGYYGGKYRASSFAAPTVTKDAVYLTHRRHGQGNAPIATYGNTDLMQPGGGSAPKRDSVEIIAFCTTATYVYLMNDGTTMGSWLLSAGVTVITTSSLPIGNLWVRMQRTGLTIDRSAAIPTTRRPHYQDYHYRGMASLRPSPQDTSLRGIDEIRYRGSSWHPMWNSPDVNREIGLIKSTGANCARFDTGWQNLEPTQGTYSSSYLTQLDSVMNLHRANGLKVILNFFTSPPWARTGGTGNYPPSSAHYADYGRAAAFLCSRYRTYLAAFEVWNEPNNAGEGAVTAAAYALLANAAYNAIKAATPEVPVIVGSTAGCDVSYTTAVVQAGAKFDGWAVHPYSGKYAPNPGYNTTNSMVPGLPTIFGIVKKGLWATEFGWSTLTGDAFYSVDEATQATRYTQAWAALNSLPYVRAAMQYNMVEDGPTNSLLDNWGLVERGTWRQKPAYATHQAGVLDTTVVTSTAKTYYVSPGGSDFVAGTSSTSPLKTLAHAATLVQPGDTVLLQGGATFSEQLAPTRSGTSGKPITWGSYGSGKARITGGIYLISCSRQTFDNLIVESPNDGIGSSSSGTGCTHTSISGCEVRNCKIGIVANHTNDTFWTVGNCYIHDTTDSGCIFWGGDVNCSFNTIYRTGLTDLGYGEHGIYSKSPRAILAANKISFFRTEGISTRFRDALIQDNEIHDAWYSGGGGIGYYNYDPTTSLTSRGTTTVVRNKIWNCHYGMYIDPGGSGGDALPGMFENWHIYNNTLVNDGTFFGQAITIHVNGASAVIVRNNACPGYSSVAVVAVESGAPALTTNAQDHNMSGSGLNLAAAPSFKPNAGSPCIDAGTTNTPGYTQPPFRGVAPDIGAVES